MAIKSHQGIDEIPINQDAMTRYVSWIMALLVYLLCLVLVGAVSISSSLYQWQVGVNYRLTVEIPIQHELDRDRIVPTVLSVLKTLPGITSAVASDHLNSMHFFQPFFGQQEQGSAPEPTFIDVALDPNYSVNLNDIAAQLYRVAPGAKIETQHRWQETIAVLRTSLQAIAYIFASLIALTVVITISLVTQSGLAAHHKTISILRLIGAQNSYISRKFQTHALKLSMKGAVIGFVTSLPTLLILSALCSHLGVPEWLKPNFDANLFLLILAVPATVIFLSICVARFAVFKTLTQAS
jgi:cell division transport system permease protein